MCIRDRLQIYWFVHLGVISELNPWDSFNPGRLDQHLNPFYEKEKAAGTLSREQAEELLQCFWIKFNNQPAPPKVGITLKESSTYFDFATINAGGLTTDGKDGVNEVSYLMLDAVSYTHLMGAGYLAIAALIFGNWNIMPTLFACLIFGFARSGAYQLMRELALPSSFSDLAMTIPYVLTLLLLIFFSKTNKAPRALGEIYDKSKR